jgi:hypothetical protein
MRAYDLAIQNFSVAEHLLQLHELFRDLHEEAATESLRIAVCKTLLLPEQTVLRQARNEQVVLVAKAAVPIPQSLLVKDGINFLLRQAVVVACTALESFFLGCSTRECTHHRPGTQTRRGRIATQTEPVAGRLSFARRLFRPRYSTATDHSQEL